MSDERWTITKRTAQGHGGRVGVGRIQHPQAFQIEGPDCREVEVVPAPTTTSRQAELDALRDGLLKATRYQVLDHGEQPEVRLRYETAAQADAVAALLNKETDR